MLFFVLLSVIILLVVLFFIFLFVPFYLEAFYTKDAVTNTVKLNVRYLGMTFSLIPKKSKKKIKQPQEEDSQSFSFDTFKQGFDVFHEKFNDIKDDIIDILKFLSRRAVFFKQLKLRIQFGFEDAMATGITKGLLDGMLYNLVGLLYRYVRIEDWSIETVPDFEHPRFDIETQCILKIKNVHIMIIAIKGLKLYFKLKK